MVSIAEFRRREMAMRLRALLHSAGIRSSMFHYRRRWFVDVCRHDFDAALELFLSHGGELRETSHRFEPSVEGRFWLNIAFSLAGLFFGAILAGCAAVAGAYWLGWPGPAVFGFVLGAVVMCWTAYFI
jgi:hypothetical protein